jgi:hypothetical protein
MVAIWKTNMNRAWVANKRARSDGPGVCRLDRSTLNPHASYNLSGQFARGMV